jgi:hypothetical protein
LSTEHNPAGGSKGYETRDANTPSLVKFAIGLAFTLVVTWAGMWWLMGYFGHVQQLGPSATPFGKPEQKQTPPLPRLQVDPVQDLVEVRKQQSGELESYGWVDRSHSIVHIPIVRAMDLILERGGLPARASDSATSGGTQKPAAPSKAKPDRGRGAQ